MPSWRLHIKWEQKLLGFSFLEVDSFIDFPRNIDSGIVKIAVEICKRNSKILTDEFQQITYYIECMRKHDAWRHCPCIFYYYIFKKFGSQGLEVAVLHVILDLLAMNVTKFGIADFSTFERITDEFFQDLSKYEFAKSIIPLLHNKVKNYLREIIDDISMKKMFRGT